MWTFHLYFFYAVLLCYGCMKLKQTATSLQFSLLSHPDTKFTGLCVGGSGAVGQVAYIWIFTHPRMHNEGQMLRPITEVHWTFVEERLCWTICWQSQWPESTAPVEPVRQAKFKKVERICWFHVGCFLISNILSKSKSRVVMVGRKSDAFLCHVWQ